MSVQYTLAETEVEKTPLIEAMIIAVHSAGNTALSFFTDDDPEFIRKNDYNKSFQLKADIKTEETLKEALKENFTDKTFSFYSEESEKIPSTFNTDIVFIADPIDGTTNFLNNNNYWGVTLSAYATDEHGHIDEPLASIIYHPKVKELVWTSAEEGFVNREKTYRIQGDGLDETEELAQRDESSKTLKSYNPLDHKNVTMMASGEANDYFFAVQKELYNQNVSIRNSGSTAISLGEVAGHGSHGMICLGETNKWDVAGGIQLADASDCVIVKRELETANGTIIPMLIVAKTQEIADELEMATINAIYYPETILDPQESIEHGQACAKARGA